MAGRRVARLELEHFKGFSERLDLDMDAEIVLLVGPNGRGKTSTIEALELILTGTIGRRIGDGTEFKLRDFIHCNRNTGERGAEALVRVTWKGEREPDEARLVAASSREPVMTSGPWATRRQEQWSSDSELELARACTFLYSDSLGSLAGLDLAARRKVIDFFVPNFPALRSLVEHEAPQVSSRLEGALRSLKANLPDLQALRAREAQQAVAAQQVWQELNGEARFVRQSSTLLGEQTLRKELRKVAGELGLTPAADEDYEPLLQEVARGAAGRADALEAQHGTEARAASGGAGAWVTVREVLRALEQKSGSASPSRVPGLEELKRRRGTLGSASALQERRDQVMAAQEEARLALKQLWQEREGSGLPEGLERTAVGTLPLLATLAGLEPAAPLPGWWLEAGLPRPDPARFQALLSKEAQRWVELRARADRLEEERRSLDAALAELAELDRLEPLLAELTGAWSASGARQPLPTRPDGGLALAEIQAAATTALDAALPASAPVGQQPAWWRRVAEAFSGWASARAAAREGERSWSGRQELEPAYKQLQKLKELTDHVGGNSRGCFSDVLRARVADQRYQKQINASLRRILRWYAHRSDIVERARIEFHRHGPLQLRVGPEYGDSTGIASLSRSQLTSVAFGLAIVANLGHPALPTAFLCLDDVSDAFDLDNLAADAAMLRLLAYGADGQGGHGRRQLILTNHNDQLTDRIVPLLLPPAGRRMRIIEFLDDGHDKPIRAKQWTVLGEQYGRWEGRSPLRMLLPEETARVLEGSKPP